jgi:uncharacterized membrane protein
VTAASNPRRTIVVALLVASAAGLGAGFALKAPCAPGDWDGKQYRRLCYSDIVSLYGVRGLSEGRFPYLETELEYPAGTGLYIGLVAKTTTTLVSFVFANAVGLALMGLGATLALAAIALDPRRVLLFALAPAMVLYAFHNWDLLAVGLTCFAMFAFLRRAYGWAGFLLGLGAATKLYPAFLLPAFGLVVWRSDRRSAVLLMLANFDGWKHPWEFQSSRGPNFETSWFMLQRHFATGSSFWSTSYASVVNWISGATFVVGAGVLLALESRRERVRPFALSFGIVALFLLTAKVFSPQYALWLLPFFAVLRLPMWSYAAFAVTDAAVWIAVSSFFLALQYHTADPAFRLSMLEVAVWARYAVLVVLLVLSRRAEELVLEPGFASEKAPVALTA